MSSERRIYRLEELCEFINGFAFKSTDYVERTEHTLEVLRMGYINRGGGFKEDSTPVFVPREYGKNLDKYMVYADDIVIAMTDMKNNVAILGNTARIKSSNRFVLNQRAGCIRVKRYDLINPAYLYYYSNWQPHVDYLRARANSGVQVNLSTSAIREAEIELPPLDEQTSTGELLSALDDRITLLRETNATLEAIAQALFKSWFVDFDPVRAKMEGRAPEGMDEATAALFPDSFEEAELGVVPRGWAIKTMSDVSTVGIGKTPPRKEQHWFSENPEDVRWVSIRDMGLVGTYAYGTSEYLTNEAVEKFNVRRVPDNTVIMSFKMTIGRVAITDGEMTTNEAIAHFKLSAGAAVSTEYLYLHFKQFDFTKLSSTSSIADAVNSKTVREIPVLVPSLDVMTVFKEKIAAIFAVLKNAEQQAYTLMTLRETLLPRLISGQLRIDDLLGVANV